MTDQHTGAPPGVPAALLLVRLLFQLESPEYVFIHKLNAEVILIQQQKDSVEACDSCWFTRDDSFEFPIPELCRL